MLRKIKESEIRRVSRGFYQGQVNSKPSWSNGEILEVGIDTPFKRIKNIDWIQKNLQNLVNSILGCVLERIGEIEIKEEFSFDDDWRYGVGVVKLKSESSTAYINLFYYSYFANKYSNLEFRIGSKIAVAVYDGGELVGLIAWLNLKNPF